MWRQISITLKKRVCICPYEMLLHLFLSKTYKLTRVTLVHIQFITVSLPKKTVNFFSPVHTNRNNTLNQQVFLLHTPTQKIKRTSHLLCGHTIFFCRFLCWYAACVYSFQVPGTGFVLQLSRSVYHWETDAACRHLKLTQQINSTTMVSGVVPVK
jgi:hypothetical protein